MINTEKIFKLMEEMNIKSIRELSIKARIPYSTLTYMIGGHDMFVSSLVALSNFFKIPTDDLIEKNVTIMCCSEEKIENINTSNIMEVTANKMCDINIGRDIMLVSYTAK